MKKRGYVYQMVSICGDWYIRKQAAGGRCLYFAGYNRHGGADWSPYFNFTFALNLNAAARTLDRVRGLGL